MMHFGLLGKGIGYSKSPMIWEKIWEKEGHKGLSFELINTDDPISFLETFREEADWQGLMVTTPYKEALLHSLDALSDVAKEVGAINAIIKVNGKLVGFNTDVAGFLVPLSPLNFKGNALVLGSGGASKAIQYALKSIGIKSKVVSRNPNYHQIGYEKVTGDLLNSVQLIVNATPLGGPKYPQCLPNIPYHVLTNKHILYDLSYSEKNGFLEAAPADCQKIDGQQMLYHQALEAYRIFVSTLR